MSAHASFSRLVLAGVALVTVVTILTVVPSLARQAPSASAGPPADLAAIAASLPPLARDAAGVDLPLTAAGSLAWRGVRDGVAVAPAASGFTVHYQVVAGAPAGAALILAPGSLAGVERLAIELSGERNGQLVVALRDGAGVVYAFPAVAVRPGGPRRHLLEVADLDYLAPASDAADSGSFAVADTVMVMLLDLAGFMGGEEVETAWTVSLLRGELGTAAADVPPVTGPATLPDQARGAAPSAVADPSASTGYGAVTPSARRHPAAVRAEERFFAVLNGREPLDRAAPLRDLMIAWLADPNDGRTQLWLGLDHLWMAAEGDRTNPRVVEHLLLAESFLARAQALLPEDRRIPSWLVPVRLALAGLERRPERAAALVAELEAAYREDPSFHSFSIALLGFPEPADSERFARGLAALRATDGTCVASGDADPTCANTPRWPHNVEAYETFFADYELKAGHLPEARARLTATAARADFARWPYRTEVEDRLANLERYAALYADGDAGNDPPSLMTARDAMCRSCHQGAAAVRHAAAR